MGRIWGGQYPAAPSSPGPYVLLLDPRLGTPPPPAWHRGLPGRSGPESQKSPKRVRTGCSGASGPGEPQSPQRVRPDSESKKRSYGLFSDSLGTLNLPRPSGPGTPFRTLFGPSLSFLSLFFWDKGKENHEKPRIFYPYRTPKIPGKEGEKRSKNKESSQGEKTRKSQKTRKGRTGLVARAIRNAIRANHSQLKPLFL